jgi:hypothetical protein
MNQIGTGNSHKKMNGIKINKNNISHKEHKEHKEHTEKQDFFAVLCVLCVLCGQLFFRSLRLNGLFLNCGYVRKPA